MKRGSGVLLGLSSLPGPFGIGTMGQGARDFIDRLYMSGQTYWQILPMSPTGYGDSPYQAFSAFAGNPYFIDFKDLYEQDMLSADALKMCVGLFGSDDSAVDYYAQYIGKPQILRLAYQHCRERLSKKLADFAHKHAAWIKDYALYMAIKSCYKMRSFKEWPQELANRHSDALKASEIELKESIDYHIFVQFLFFKQWEALRRYANEKGIQIIGDMPIYMAPDSADAWAHCDILDKDAHVAGCPPDYFAATGQLWGNPVYDWQALKKTGYEWWISRIAHQLTLCDHLRIDHFRAFESYYAIPKDAKTAETGSWKPGPGIGFFKRIEEKLGLLPLIAEDLGFLTPQVFELLHATGFPGLKVLQFAFEPHGSSCYLPYKYDKNCVVYTGTHDNDTTTGWFGGLHAEERVFLDAYLDGTDEQHISWQLIRLAMASTADVCIIPMQDILSLPGTARMNKPQTSQGNWCWRLQEGKFNDAAVDKLSLMTWIFGRVEQNRKPSCYQSN